MKTKIIVLSALVCQFPVWAGDYSPAFKINSNSKTTIMDLERSIQTDMAQIFSILDKGDQVVKLDKKFIKSNSNTSEQDFISALDKKIVNKQMNRLSAPSANI